MLKGHFIKVIFPLDHTATEEYSFIKAVSLNEIAGGVCLLWVVSVDDVSKVGKRLYY
jgi:hypothetical protein